MIDALRSHRKRNLVISGLTAIALVLPVPVALAQQPVIVGGASGGPGVEVNLNAIYGTGGAPQASRPSYSAAGQPRGLLIPNLHDPDTGQVIGTARVNLVPPRGSSTQTAVASPSLRQPQMAKPSLTKPSTARTPAPATPARTVSAPPAPSPPPIQPAKPKAETAMAKPESAGRATARPAPAPSPPPIRSLTPAPPPKSMASSAPKRMPEPPALPPAPSSDTAMAKPQMPSSSMADKAMGDKAKAGQAMAEKTMDSKSMTPAPPPPPPPAASSGSTGAPSAPARVAALSPAGDVTHQLRFGAGSAALSTNAEAALKSFAGDLKENDDRVQLRAYADKSGGNASRARRLSLSRALAVRSFLIESGLRSTRIDVRALGAVPDGGPADRVDVIRLER